MGELDKGDVLIDIGKETYPWGESTKGFNTIRARTREGLIINMDILISYKLTTSNEGNTKAE